MKNSRIYSLKEDSYDEPLNLEDEPLNLEEKLIIILKENQKINRIDLANMLKISRSTLYRLLKKLISKGIIIRVGSKKDGYWKIKDW